MGFFRRRWVWIIAASIAVAAVLAFTRPETPTRPRPAPSWTVDTVPAEPRALAPEIELFGRIESPRDAQVRAAIEAGVLEVPVRDGSRVAEGEVMVLLDGRDADLEARQREAELRDLRAQRRLAQRRLARARQAFEKEQELLQISRRNAQRAEELSSQGVLSRADVDSTSEALKRQQLAVNQAELSREESELAIVQIDAQLARADALLGQARLKQQRARVTAPFAGLVSGLEVSPGDRVRVGDPLLRLQDPSRVEVRTQVPSRYVRQIQSGLAGGARMPVRVILDRGPVTATVVRLAGQTREGSGGVDAFIAFDTPPAGVRLGATVTLEIRMPPLPGLLAVPSQAVYGEDRIYVVADGRMRAARAERVGERRGPDGRTEVLLRAPGLAAGTPIVATKLSNAADGLPVRIAGDPADEPVSPGAANAARSADAAPAVTPEP